MLNYSTELQWLYVRSTIIKYIGTVLLIGRFIYPVIDTIVNASDPNFHSLPSVRFGNKRAHSGFLGNFDFFIFFKNNLKFLK